MARLVRCKVKPDQLEALYDGELPPWRAKLLSAHVAVCGRCQARLRELRTISMALSELDTIEPSPDFTPAVVAAVRLSDQLAAGGDVVERPVLAAMAAELEAPADVGGPGFVDAVMSRVRAEAQASQSSSSPMWLRPAQLWRVAAGLAVATTVAAIAAILILAMPSARHTALMIDARLSQTLHLASSPLQQVRAVAEGLLAMRIRQAKEAGLRLEDIGLPSEAATTAETMTPETIETWQNNEAVWSKTGQKMRDNQGDSEEKNSELHTP